MNETNEPGFLQDWNFIHVRDSDIIYDLTTGIEYAYAENGKNAVLYIWQVGSKNRRTDPVYEDDIAREFWRQLVARVVM